MYRYSICVSQLRAWCGAWGSRPLEEDDRAVVCTKTLLKEQPATLLLENRVRGQSLALSASDDLTLCFRGKEICEGLFEEEVPPLNCVRLNRGLGNVLLEFFKNRRVRRFLVFG